MEGLTEGSGFSGPQKCASRGSREMCALGRGYQIQMTPAVAKWESGHPALGHTRSWLEGGGVAGPSGKSNVALTWHLLSAAGPVIC